MSDTSPEEGQLQPRHHSEQETNGRALETPVSEAGERQRSLQRAGGRKERREASGFFWNLLRPQDTAK